MHKKLFSSRPIEFSNNRFYVVEDELLVSLGAKLMPRRKLATADGG